MYKCMKEAKIQTRHYITWTLEPNKIKTTNTLVYKAVGFQSIIRDKQTMFT